MARTEDPEKLPAIVAAAAEMYAFHGFKRTQVADVASRAGVALGTVYRYAKSKEALFDAALRYSFGVPEENLRERLRGERPSRTEIVEYARRFAREAELFPVLRGLVTLEDQGDPAEELCAVVGELYGVLDEYSLAICIVEQSAREWPELAKAFGDDMRGPLLADLHHFVESRCKTGRFVTTPDSLAASRFILELCAEFTRGRKFSPTGDNYASDAVARETVTFFACRGLLADPCSMPVEIGTGDVSNPNL